MASSPITEVTAANFDAEVMKSDKMVLIDFYADWCGPCKAMAPTLAEFARENPDVKVVKINVDHAPELTQAFGIKSIPTLVTFKDGKGLAGAVGNLPKSAMQKLVAEAVKMAASAHISPKPPGSGPKG